MDTYTHFIIGPNGVGKSTTLSFLKKFLPSESFEIYDFEERGAPNIDFLEWVKLETQHWVDVGAENQKNGKRTIVCGFARPEEVEELFARNTNPASVILLDADPMTIQDRISAAYDTEEKIQELYNTTGKTPKEVMDENIFYSKFLRQRCTVHGTMIVDTSDKTPEMVASEVIAYIYG